MTTTNTARCIARTITLNGREVRVECTRSPWNDAERVFRAWEPVELFQYGTISSLGLGGGLFGLMGTEQLSDELDAEGLRGDARVCRFNELFAANAERARSAILAAFPELQAATNQLYRGSCYELCSSDVQL